MENYKVRLSEGGRLVIPAKVRKRLGLKAGDEVAINVSPEGEATISSVRRSVARAQGMLAKYVKGGGSMADELIAERRREVARERK